MTKIFPDRINPSVLLVTVVFAFAACNSLSPSDGKPAPDSVTAKPLAAKPPLPHMWVPDSLSTKNEQNFQFLASLLRNPIAKDETDSIYYSADEFIGMIDSFAKNPCNKYVDVFLVAFGNFGSSNVPSKPWEKRLTPLFMPVDTCTNQQQFYLLPEGGSGFDPRADRIPTGIANNWMTNYNSSKLNILNGLLDPRDKGNYPNGITALGISNTKHVAYFLADFEELKAEKDYQVTLGHTITGFKLFFSSFNPLGNGLNAYANRLYPQFEFTTGSNNQVFHIDTAGRKIQPLRWLISCKGLDNGQMCPPTCTP